MNFELNSQCEMTAIKNPDSAAAETFRVVGGLIVAEKKGRQREK